VARQPDDHSTKAGASVVTPGARPRLP